MSVEEYDCGISASILYHLFNYHGTSSWFSETRAPRHPLLYFSTFKVLWFHFFWGWSSFPCDAFPLTIHICGSAPMKEITVMLHFLPYYSFLQQIHSLLTFMLPVLGLPNFLDKILHLWRYLSTLRKEESYLALHWQKATSIHLLPCLLLEECSCGHIWIV